MPHANPPAIQWRKSSYSGNNGGNCVELGLTWRKSSRSSNNGGNCVELAANWRKSSRSSNNGGDCVELTELAEAPRVAVRDSKRPDQPHLCFARPEWSAFTAGVRSGCYDPTG